MSQSLLTPSLPTPGTLPAALERRAAPRLVMEILPADGPVRNALLTSLPAEELALLEPHLERVRLEQRDILFDAERPILHVYFPETAVVSLVSTLRAGNTVEVGTAGCEGMAGLSVFLAEDISTVRAVVQIPGVATRISVEDFTRLAAPPGALHRLMLRYAAAFLTQVAQTAACNGAHLVEERCARWLLMTHDRAGRDTFPLTHEFLAFMLAVRRAGVTEALGALRAQGLVSNGRGVITVVDRAGLERASCECYRVVRAHFERLFGGASGPESVRRDAASTPHGRSNGRAR